jgi:GTPase SAR1 family protein
LPDEEIKKRLTKINDQAFDGVVLGVSTYTGLPLVIPDYYLNQVALVLGTTGSGKTITLRRFYQRAIQKNYPLIIVDGKPDDANIAWLTRLAEKYQRKFYGFNCANYFHYDPLAKGGHTELKDKIISLKDKWENDYYRSIAEDYLQTTFEVLLASKQPLYLKTVVDCLNFDELQTIARSLKNEKLSKRVESLAQYNRADITGLQAHLNILIHSELGQYFDEGENSFNLSHVIADNAIVYFALPALRFPSFSKVLGKLVINDIKAVIDCINNQDKKIFTIFDEFSVFAGEQVLNLVNMGRGKGVHAIFGTQGLADLDRVDNIFKNQVLNCVNTLICHRLNDVESAEGIANWIATEDTFNVTAQLNLRESDGGIGSVKVHKEYIVHPDEIKKGLGVGEAFYVSKVDGFNKNKVRVKY